MLFNDKKLNDTLLGLSRRLRLPESFLPIVEHIYQPLAEIIVNQAAKSLDTTFVSINGCQGSGKTTLTLFLKTILEQRFEKSAAIISLDDFYLKKKERLELSQTVHP